MYRCKICNSEKIQQKEWTNVNTGEFESIVEPEEYYCENCGDLIPEIYDDELEQN